MIRFTCMRFRVRQVCLVPRRIPGPTFPSRDAFLIRFGSVCRAGWVGSQTHPKTDPKRMAKRIRNASKTDQTHSPLEGNVGSGIHSRTRLGVRLRVRRGIRWGIRFGSQTHPKTDRQTDPKRIKNASISRETWVRGSAAGPVWGSVGGSVLDPFAGPAVKRIPKKRIQNGWKTDQKRIQSGSKTHPSRGKRVRLGVRRGIVGGCVLDPFAGGRLGWIPNASQNGSKTDRKQIAKRIQNPKRIPKRI